MSVAWSIPAKTFFIGEYAAVIGAPAIMLTTTPCFKVSLTHEPGLHDIHPDSPAGRFWVHTKNLNNGLHWYDPYNGCGGVGASSAQWLGAYYAHMHLQNKPIIQDAMLDAYFQFAWNGLGLRPSGYDVLAQSLSACVFIHRNLALCETYSWPFDDVACILLHTGQKLATHNHLQTLTLPNQLKTLTLIAQMAQDACITHDSARMIAAINAYHQQLCKMNLVAPHSLQQIAKLQSVLDILAIKGCGAMGADVILLVVAKANLNAYRESLSAFKFNVLATSENLYIHHK